MTTTMVQSTIAITIAITITITITAATVAQNYFQYLHHSIDGTFKKNQFAATEKRNK